MSKGRLLFRGLGILTIVVLTVLIGARWQLNAMKADRALTLSRLKPFVEVPPAPEPSGLPLLGTEGFTADGDPTQYVDQAGLRSLLKHRRFAALDLAFEHFQAAFEKDPRFEQWPTDAAAAFDSAEPSLGLLLDEWADNSKTFAPWLARGTHLGAVAGAQRGTTWAADTSRGELAEMRATLPVALQNLERALELRPKLVAARSEEIWVRVLMGDAFGFQESVRLADESCPTCFMHRAAVMRALQPRWGGSYEAMRAYAKRAPVAQNAKLRLLTGFVPLDRAMVADTDGRLPDALAQAEEACAVGEYWGFLVKRGYAKKRLGALDEALADLDHALVLRPGAVDALVGRAHVYLAREDGEHAGRDLLAAMRVRPTDAMAEQLYGATVQTLIHDAWAFRNAGKREDALRLLDLASDLAPLDGEVLGRRVIALTDGDAGIEDLRAQADAAPDDFRSHQVLDYALSKENRFEEIAQMWTVFLARQPTEGRAFSERAGTFVHLGRQREALEDLEKACELGVTEGCARLKR